jgi:excisionase family DNA binding protein
VQPLAFSKGELLTVREVASLLRLKTVATVYRYVAKGKLKAVRWGPLIRITRAALHLFLDSNQRGRKRRR